MTETADKLRTLFHPRSVAFIGASNNPNKWGSIILANLINGGFEGPIYPINPQESEIRGLRAYARVADLNETPDLAVIVIPPSAIPPVIDQCAAKGIRAGLVITAGFAEVGNDGKRLQSEMADKARRGRMVFAGPNCNGIMRPSWKLYSTMASFFPPPGPIAVVSQSGNVGLSIIRRLSRKGFGCSFYVGTGNEASLHCEDYLSYIVDDPDTRVILSYMEGLGDGRRFFETAKKVTKKKPLVMLKAGGTNPGAKAAESHTGALAGSDLAFDGACKQAGVIRAKDVEDLCNIGMAFIGQPLPKGKRIGIITAGGGWGVLASDACAKAGLEVPALPDHIIAELDGFLPAWWSRSNPVDLVAGLSQDHMRKSLESLLRSPEIDGVLLLGLMAALPMESVPPSPSQHVVRRRTQDMISMVSKVFEEFMGLAEIYQKPIIIGSEFPNAVPDFENLVGPRLGEKGYICYPKPEDAAKAMAGLARHAQYVLP